MFWWLFWLLLLVLKFGPWLGPVRPWGVDG
jgi:hypothetical protein